LARPRARCAALGLPAQDGVFVAVLVEPGPGGEDAELRARLHRELRSAGIAALVGELSPGRLGVLLALRPGRPWHPAAERLSRTARELAPGATVGVGAEVADLAGVARRGGLSRETVYQRLRTVERLLGTDLASGERRTELHVALTALRVLRSG
jgi:hypothetical protein